MFATEFWNGPKCWVLFHTWETTHVNKWMIPTRQVCRCCRMVRRKETNPDKHTIGGEKRWPRMEWRWVTSCHRTYPNLA